MKPFTKWGIVGLAAVMILVALPAMAGQGPTARPDQNQQLRVVDAYGKLPMSFEANRGQADPSVRFLARGSGYGLFLGKNEVQLSLAGTSGGRGATADAAAHLTLSLLGANRSPSIQGVDLLPGRVNYFLGSDPAKWRTDIPTFEKVRYEEIYPGVDMLCYGNQHQLEFDFLVKPGADPTDIRLAFKGAKGLRLSPEGDLLISMPGGEVAQRRPVVYQDVDGQRCFLRGSYVMVSPSAVGFRLDPYDRTRPVIIDPVLAYSTFLGGTGNDYGQRIAVDASGNAYVVGYTSSNLFPGTAGSAIQPAYAGGTNDAFVTKIDPSGTTILYSTYLGGSGDDEAYGIALDGNGDAYITGGTNSPDYPIKYPYQLYSGGGYDVFVAEINSVGNDLVFSTYLGGKTGDDGGYGIALDPGGDVYVDGNTNSTDFPVIFPIQAACNPGPMHAFLSRFHFNGTTDALSLVYSTYLGGSGTDRALALAVDATGAYVAGLTTSPDFPTLNAFQGNLMGPQNAFLCKVAFSGSVLSFVYSTYLGGTGSDQANAVRVDGSGNAIIVGSTTSLDFPLLNPFQPLYAGNGDAFISKFTSSGSALVFSTYLGGSDADQAQDVALDSSGNVYIVGSTSSVASSPSIAFPLANPISSPTGGGEAFVTEFNPTGNLMANSTFLSGSAQDAALGVAVDSSGAAYVTGLTNSSDFPTTAGALQPLNGGNTDAFLSKLVVPGGTCTLGCAASVPAAGYVGQPIAFTSALTQANCSSVTYDWDWGDQTTHGNTATGSHTYTATGKYTWVFTATGNGGTTFCRQSGIISVVNCCLSCTASVPASATTGASVSFTATATPSAGVVYDWNFGDGSPHANTATATHIYTSPGAYTWSMVATLSGISCAKSGTITVTGTACAITCSADVIPTSGVAPLPVTFTANATGTSGCGNVLNYDWNFGDGSPHGTTVTANHLYVNPGTYGWTLTVSVGTVSCTKTGTVLVVGPLTCSANAAPTSGTAPLAVNFTSTVSGGFPPYTYAWDLGDGTTATQSSLTHTYDQLTGGTYRATFTVTDSQGQICSDSHLVITVAPQCILTCSAAAQTTGTAGTPVAFAGSATLSNCPGSILYAWAFGDGATSSSQYPTHVYATAGTYTWTMTVTAAGLTCTRSGSVAIGVKPITLAWIKKLDSPFRIVVHGTNLQYGVQVYINGAQWGNLTWKNTYKLILKGGNSLQAAVPMNVPTQFRFVNPDGSELTVIWQWP